MTIQEASQHYRIPMHILREYESWGLCGAVKKVMGDWQYDDTDLERLSTIMTSDSPRKRWKSICGFCWREHPPARSGCAYWRKSEVPLWMRSTSRSTSCSGWITCGMRSGKRRDEQEVS